MSDRLKALADAVDPAFIMDNDARDDLRRQAAALIRAASAETVGTEWGKTDVGRHPRIVFCGPDGSMRGLDDKHNADLHAARLAVAAARAECERHRNDAFRHAETCRTLDTERAALQRAIDEAAVIASHSDPCQLTFDEIAGILRPHATKATDGQLRTAAHYTPDEVDANVDAICDKAKPPRQWTSTPPKDRSGKWWNAWNNKDGSHGIWSVPFAVEWEIALREKGTAYDLWLPWQEGDTKDNLPPLPNSSATVTGSPSFVMAKVGEIRKGKPSQGPLGEARDIAFEIIRKAEAERISATAAEAASPAADACDTRELVARLANVVKWLAVYLATKNTPKEWEHIAKNLDAIEAAARRGGGA